MGSETRRWPRKTTCSARYDLDRLEGIFSHSAHKLHGQSYVGTILVLETAKGGVASACEIVHANNLDMRIGLFDAQYVRLETGIGAAGAAAHEPNFHHGEQSYIKRCAMIVTSQSANSLGCSSGSWKIWSLSDGHVDMPADLLRRGPGLGKYTPPGPSRQQPSLVRLSVNCFLLEESVNRGVLIDCGAGGRWEPSLGHLERAMAEASIDPSSIAVVALTHTHLDHLNGLLTRDGREAFASLSRIVIAHDAVASFVGEPHLARFRPLLVPIGGGDRLTDHLVAVAMPGHAAGHMGYLLDSGEDRILFCGDLIHVPAAQFARPELTWAYDDNQSMACATRIKLLREASDTNAWLAGAHMAKPGIGRIVREGSGYAFLPIA